MIARWPVLMVVFALGVGGASLLPSVRRIVGLPSEPAAAQLRAHAPEQQKPVAEPGNQQHIKLTADQIAAADIELAPVRLGFLTRRIAVPGSIIPDADRIARVSVKLSATVAELRKKLGDPVIRDEVIAVLESREVADAKSEYLAAKLTDELQQELFERDKLLWNGHVSTEQQFLRSRNAAAQTKMRLDIARQKLLALGLAEKDITALPNQPEASLRRQDVRAPMAGRVVERKVDLGTAVGRDNLETELFVIVDLDRVWVELAVSPADLPAIKEGQSVAITARGATEKGEGKIVFIGPLLDKDTRSARVVAEMSNANGVWRPGTFVAAAIAVDEQAVPMAVPTGAIQTIGGEPVVFVRTPEGFQKRPIALGRSDGGVSEVVSGLQAGETIAVTNTFPLKAELMKAEAED